MSSVGLKLRATAEAPPTIYVICNGTRRKQIFVVYAGEAVTREVTAEVTAS